MGEMACIAVPDADFWGNKFHNLKTGTCLRHHIFVPRRGCGVHQPLVFLHGL